MIFATKHTSSHKQQINTNRGKNRSRVSRRAAIALMAIATTSSVDTIHAFSESFPQHMIHANGNHHHVGPSTFAAPTFLSNHHHRTLNQDVNRCTSTTSCGSAATSSTTALFYAQNPHTSKTGPMVAQAIFSSFKTNRNPTKPRNASSSSMPLSNSVLMSSDTLPAFSTAHGLLSPETVMRMELTTTRGRDQAVDFFLETYRKEGPMACLPLLSDQEVLPRLTQAMRDIIA